MSDAGQSIVIAGAGPHGLTACAYLVAADPAIADRLIVVDPDGWLARWDRDLAALDIRWLRSSCVHHPHPEPYALVTAAGDASPHLRGPYSNPSRAFFRQFCDGIRAGLPCRLIRDRVTALRPYEAGTCVVLASGRMVDAERVVMATNPRRHHVPRWAHGAPPRGPKGIVVHARDVDLRSAQTRGRSIVIVGGGLTAVQLAVGAARRGARVTLLTRRPLVKRAFDVTPGWMTFKLESFLAAPPRTRGRMVAAARRRGTVPAEDMEVLADFIHNGAVVVCEGVHVEEMSWRGRRPYIRSSGGAVIADEVWLATGSRADLRLEPALSDLHRAYPARLVGGLPVLDGSCRWPGTEIHLMGGLSGLETGPLAPNLAGARIAAERIAATVGRVPAQYPLPGALVAADAGRTRRSSEAATTPA